MNCTSGECVQIVRLLGGEIEEYYGEGYMWSRYVVCISKIYEFSMSFSDRSPAID